MREISLHRHAANYLKRMPEDRRGQMIAALGSLREVAHIGEHPHVKAMRGEWDGQWRMRVAALRVIFRMVRSPEGAEAIDVLQIGPRGDVYK